MKIAVNKEYLSVKYKTFEKYMHTVVNDMLRQNMTVFPLTSHRLETEMGRHNSMVCNLKQPGSEHHF